MAEHEGKRAGGRNEMTCPNDDREQGSGVECKRNESKSRWLYVDLSYLPNTALMRTWRKKTYF